MCTLLGARVSAGLCAALLSCGAPPSPPPSVQPVVHLWIGGDVHLGVPGSDALAGLPQLPGFGVVNLEGPVARAVSAGAGVRLANGLDGPARLAAAGVRVAGVINNHQDDAGPAGLDATRAALLAGEVMPADGTPTVVTVAGGAVAVAQYDLSGGQVPELGPLLRQDAHLRVAMFHVTGPPSYLPRPELRVAVEAAIAAGVDVVAAHGTHAMGPVERRGQQIIAWGLGNLAFSCPCTREDEGLLLEVAWRADHLQAWVRPVLAGLDGEPAKPAPDPQAVYVLLEALGSSALQPDGARAAF